MDHHQFYRMTGTALNHYPSSFTPNYGIPASFSRHAGFGGQFYESRGVQSGANTGATLEYGSLSQFWNFTSYHPNYSVPDINPPVTDFSAIKNGAGHSSYKHPLASYLTDNVSQEYIQHSNHADKCASDVTEDVCHFAGNEECDNDMQQKAGDITNSGTV